MLQRIAPGGSSEFKYASNTDTLLHAFLPIPFSIWYLITLALKVTAWQTWMTKLKHAWAKGGLQPLLWRRQHLQVGLQPHPRRIQGPASHWIGKHAIAEAASTSDGAQDSDWAAAPPPAAFCSAVPQLVFQSIGEFRLADTPVRRYEDAVHDLETRP